MRLLIIPLTLLLLFGCASKSATSNEVVSKTGVITLKEVVDPDSIDQQSKSRTSVFGSFSSGGGVSIGLGFLLGSFNSGEPKQNPVRYQVKLLDDSEVNFYHLSRDFEVGDCVEISMHEDMEKNPPGMKRTPDACL